MRSRLCHLLALGLMLGARAQTTAPQPPSQEDPPAASQQAGVLQPGILEPGIPGRALFERGILGGGAQAGGLQGATFAQARIDMTSDARSLIVATHPDDPYRGLALWLRRQYGHRVRVIVATQGAGGQNAVGPELGEELAALRVRETLAAARQLGVELRFLGLRDFGYCREAAEALDRWRDEGAEQAMQRELVDFAPDFVWTPHSMFETHGQKAAVVELLVRALNSTPRVRPSFFHAPAELEPPRLRWDLRALDPLEGRPFRELAHAALLLHRTQGPHGSVSEEIAPELLFVGTGLAPSEWQSRLDQVEVLRPASGQFSDHLREWLAQPRRLEDWVRELAGLRQRWLGIAARMRPGDRTRERLERRVRALSRALLLSSRVHVEAPAPIEVTSDGEELQAVVRVRNDGEHAVLLTQPPRGSESLLSWKHEEQQLPPGAARVLTIRLQAAGRMLSESTEISLPLRILGQDLSVAVPVELRVKRALQIEARPEQRYLVPAAGAVVRLSLAIRKERPGAWRGQLTMLAPLDVAFLPEANEDPLPIWIQLPERAIDRLVAVRVRLPDYERRAGEGRLPWVSARFGLRDAESNQEKASCQLAFRPVRVRVPLGLRIGIVRGPDDTIEEALRSFGVDVVALDERSLARVDLGDYHTVLVDSRALHRRYDAVAWIPRLRAHAERGGHLVVLYHKDSEFNEDVIGARLAPYPLELGKERITREDAPVKVLAPEHRLLNVPNRILAGDWDGWVQERGLYLPKMGAYDARFDELIEIQELPFEKESSLRFEPQRGALLFARAGKGSYVYCALVLHRQLRAYHPGVARILLNLVTPQSWERFSGEAPSRRR